MSSIGERLREERLRKGLSIDQVAENTRISSKYLEALESGDLDRIPGRFFARSFLRQYARAVGIDEREVSPELDRLTEAEPLATAEALHRPAQRIEVEPIGDGSPRMGQRTWASVGVFVLMLLGCSLIYVLWEKTQRAPAPADEAPAHQKPQATPQQPIQPNPAEQAPADQPATTPAESPAASGAQPQAPEAGVEGQQPAPSPATPAAGSGPIRLQLTTNEPAWIRVTVDGKVVMANTLEPGTARDFGGSQAIRIRTGNAGALEINYNGKSVGPIGPKGQIRTVEFTPSEFHAVTPAPKPVAVPAEPKPETQQ